MAVNTTTAEQGISITHEKTNLYKMAYQRIWGGLVAMSQHSKYNLKTYTPPSLRKCKREPHAIRIPGIAINLDIGVIPVQGHVYCSESCTVYSGQSPDIRC